MNLKNLFISVAFGGLLSACGGPIDEAPEATEVIPESFETTEQMICEGWDNGGRYCSYKCTSTSEWRVFAYGTVAYGSCQEAANRACGRTAYGACWSKF